ncbi:hypothetical protein [Cryobacterium ruanii]|uniref:Lipoprotein LpqN n=1 Tax=Cryobacterium ruanii TaxID=1259197 RepID=A0A4R9AM12_9MICO|nr:hypothetical protein [Cryobacterium ruanii]TFD65168.1 hypothetical protein E3T47_09915 [Cryobacterium ruanii]
MKCIYRYSATAMVAAVVALVAAGCSASASSEIVADYPSYATSEQLAEASSLIATVTVGESRQDILYPSKDQGDDPQTNPELGAEMPGNDTGEARVPIIVWSATIDSVYYGEATSGATIEIKKVGGELDGQPVIERDGVPLVQGQKYLLFLETYPDAAASIVAGTQGQYLLHSDGSLTAADPDNDISLTLDELNKALKL